MIKAIFRLTDVERQKIFRLREMGVRPPDIARRFGLSEGVVHKIVQSQRAMHSAAARPKMGPQHSPASEGPKKQEAS